MSSAAIGWQLHWWAGARCGARICDTRSTGRQDRGLPPCRPGSPALFCLGRFSSCAWVGFTGRQLWTLAGSHVVVGPAGRIPCHAARGSRRSPSSCWPAPQLFCKLSILFHCLSGPDPPGIGWLRLKIGLSVGRALVGVNQAVCAVAAVWCCHRCVLRVSGALQVFTITASKQLLALAALAFVAVALAGEPDFSDRLNPTVSTLLDLGSQAYSKFISGADSLQSLSGRTSGVRFTKYSDPTWDGGYIGSPMFCACCAARALHPSWPVAVPSCEPVEGCCSVECAGQPLAAAARSEAVR